MYYTPLLSFHCALHPCWLGCNYLFPIFCVVNVVGFEDGATSLHFVGFNFNNLQMKSWFFSPFFQSICHRHQLHKWCRFPSARQTAVTGRKEGRKEGKKEQKKSRPHRNLDKKSSHKFFAPSINVFTVVGLKPLFFWFLFSWRHLGVNLETYCLTFHPSHSDGVRTNKTSSTDGVRRKEEFSSTEWG